MESRSFIVSFSFHFIPVYFRAFQLVQDRVDNVETSANETSEQLQRRTPRVTWQSYSSWKLQGSDLYIGRKPVLKFQTNDIKLSVAMVIPN